LTDNFDSQSSLKAFSNTLVVPIFIQDTLQKPANEERKANESRAKKDPWNQLLVKINLYWLQKDDFDCQVLSRDLDNFLRFQMVTK